MKIDNMGVGLDVKETEIRNTESKECGINGKRKFSQAMDVMVNTCKTLVGYFSKAGVSASFILIMKKTKSFWVKKEDKTQKPKVEPKVIESDEETREYENVLNKAGVDNNHRCHRWQCKADNGSRIY